MATQNIAKLQDNTGKVIYPVTHMNAVVGIHDELDKLKQPGNVSPMAEITYAEIVALRDAGELVPGMIYRITDYTCTTTQDDTQSAHNDFDIIVTAVDVDKVSETARAIRRAGDTYFENSNLEAWQIWYTLGNDTTKYGWADPENGKGVVYRMIDEFNNDCPYDFKSIQFKRYWTDGKSLFDGTQILNGYFALTDNQYNFDNITLDNSVWCYTFNFIDNWENDYSQPIDASLNIGIIRTNIIPEEDYHPSEACINNIIKQNYVILISDDNASMPILSLNNIVFLNEAEIGSGPGIGNDNTAPKKELCHENNFSENNFNMTFGPNCNSNTFGNHCYSNTFGNNCYSNTFGNNCGSNTFGNNCDSNTFGNDCGSNTFGNDCGSNTFGNDCNSNTFGNDCGSNTFGNHCYSNTFGNHCYSNTFGNHCNSNTFGNNCDSNTFGNDCGSNTFGNHCYSNTFGNNCGSNTFGNDCNSNTFGNHCYSNTFGNNCYSNTFGNHCYSNTFGNHCNSNTFGNNCDSNTFGVGVLQNELKFDHVIGVRFDDTVAYVNLKPQDTTATILTKYLANIHVLRGVHGGKRTRTNNSLSGYMYTVNTTYPRLDIVIDTYAQDYEICAGFTSDKELRIWASTPV